MDNQRYNQCLFTPGIGIRGKFTPPLAVTKTPVFGLNSNFRAAPNVARMCTSKGSIPAKVQSEIGNVKGGSDFADL